MGASKINLAQLSDAQKAELFAQMKAAEEAAREAEKAAREALKVVAHTAAQTLVSDHQPVTFSSGAEGYNTGGKMDVTLADGTVRNVTVSLLVRFTDTIPAKEK